MCQLVVISPIPHVAVCVTEWDVLRVPASGGQGGQHPLRASGARAAREGR